MARPVGSAWWMAPASAVSACMSSPGDDPATLAREAVAAGADAVGVAGGDGSLGLVAAVAVELDVPFVCVPAGTRNHFAHDLGLDRADPLAALGVFSGPERRIDVAMVGGRMFLNNVSLGVYADVVAEPGYRARKLATAHGVLQAAVRGERARLAVEFADPDGRLHEEVLVLLVANNKYQLQRASELGARDRLDDGVLQVSALRARTGAALARVVAKATVGRAGSGVAWAQWETPRCGSTASFRSFLPGSTGRWWCCRRRLSSGSCRGPCACWSPTHCGHQRPERGP